MLLGQSCTTMMVPSSVSSCQFLRYRNCSILCKFFFSANQILLAVAHEFHIILLQTLDLMDIEVHIATADSSVTFPPLC
ncbi:hypothetical protein Goarm_002099 [Gossypium armourianum]|uniref:Uncharacterized protein n=1 Tax=Gossypium armourianum TaxID=34283 RepID=A0A7J9K782_9ROSI|nr:hypothetical protein [Gossypium armourianum]